MTVIGNIVAAISGVLYQPWCVPLLLVFGGIWFTTCRTGLMQVRLFGESIRVVSEKPHTENGISSFGALMVSTASRVGTGNIIGVSAAIISGGEGAIFWMWVTAFLGGATAFVESTLAQVYKKKNPDGTSYGGPAFYMQQALHARWLGIIFSILIIFTYAVGYNMLAAYNLQTSFKAFDFYSKTSTPAVIGVILMVLFAVIVLGGAKRLVNVTGILVPVMGVLYVAISILVLVLNAGNLPAMFGRIFASAFDFKAIFGGFTGSCLMFGLKRGLYSNEAGMGSAPNAAATADVSHPAKQGLVQMLSVFIDTLLICSATALMCLSTNVMLADYATKEPIEFVQDSMSSTLGSFGPVFVTVALTLFAFTTLIGNYSYCEGCLKFILKKDPSPAFLTVFRLVASAIILLGAISSANLVWDTADMAQGLMVVTNVPSILILSGVALKCFKDYERQRKEGKNPVFKAANIGLFDKLDFWQ